MDFRKRSGSGMMSSRLRGAASTLLFLLEGLVGPAIGLSQAKVTIATTSLSDGTVGVAYSQSLSAKGGRAPYTWSVTTGALPSGVTLSSSGTLSGTPKSSGASQFAVKVQDSAGAVDTQSLSLTINSNPAITTASLPDATAGSPYSAALAASGAVPPLTWSVSAGALPQGLTLAPATGAISGTPSTAGTATFTVKVTDSAGGAATKGLSLTVAPDPPTITTKSLPNGTVGTSYSQALNATGGTTPYLWTIANGSLPAGLALSLTGTISGTPTIAGSSSFVVRVTDLTLASVTTTLTIAVDPAPVNITTATLPAGTVGTAYSQSLAATGGSPPYTWTVSAGSLPAGLNLSSGGTISGTPTTAGSGGFTVKATDSKGATDTQVLSIAINPPPLNITTSSLPAGTVGTAYSQALSASGGTPPYTWTVSAGALPPGLTLSAGGTISGTPSKAGSSSFTAKVTDSKSATDTAPLSITINAPVLNITTSSLPAGTVGTAYSQALSASGGTPPYAWTIASGSLPAGLNLSGGGTISGTPSAAGPSSFTVKVTDSASATDTAALSIAINPPALTVTTSSLPAGTVGSAYSQTLKASGGTPPYAWTIASGSLPAGLNLSGGGTISGTPSAAGPSSFTVKVTDSASATDTAALSIAINPPALTVTTSSLPAGTVGTAYSGTLGAAGGTPPYSWTIASGSLPAGLNLGGGGTISGTPSAAASSSFTVKVTDSASATATAPLSITINPPVLTVTTSSLPTGTVGTAYSGTLGASGGTPPYNWTLASGSLPAGLNLGGGGTISGTPSAAVSSSFTVKVTDSASASATSSLSITINPPVLTVTTSSFPPGTAGTAYSGTLSAAGGTPPYSWSIAAGSLPPGLNLSGGAISGTPSVAGSSNFTIKVTDSASASASASLSITINPPAMNITTSQLNAGNVSAVYSQSLAATGGSPPYSWSVISGSLPAGLNLSAAGSLNGTPVVVGSSSFLVQAADSVGNKAVKTLTLQIEPALIQITTSSLSASTVSGNYLQPLTATGGSPPYSWSVSGGTLPPGLTLDPAGSIRGTATSAGSYTFTVQVTDNSGGSAVTSLAVTINSPVSIQTSSLADALIGAAYSQQLRATGGTPPYTWSVSAGSLPDGLKLDASAGTLTGTPTTVGTFNFTVRVADSAQASATRQFQITTTAGLLITSAPILAAGTVGSQYGQALVAAGGKAPYLWSISAGGLPAGIVLDTSAGVLAGIPSAAGTFQFTVAISDSVGSKATKQFTLTVSSALVISSAPQLPQAVAGSAYSQTLAASGGAPPYVWSISSGGLPAGLSLDAGSGTVSGTATQGGSYSFAVLVTDSNSVTATKQFTVQVSSNLTITSASLAPASAGSSYSQTLSATGGVPPYVWTVKSGSLPPGLALDSAAGTLAGTPNQNGTFTFTLQVADASGALAAQDYTFSIGLPPIPSANINGLSDPATAASQPAFTVSLPTSYPVQLTGQIVLSFAPDASAGVDDPSVQFATGGRTVNFTIPAGSTSAVFSAGQMALQTGTVAGAITLNLSLQSPKGEQTGTASNTVHVAAAAPVAQNLQVVHTAGGFELHVTGYSTPRQVNQAVVQLTPAAGSNLQTTQLSVDLSSLSSAWYQSTNSRPFGSQFTLVLPFSISGNASDIDSVAVTLVNGQGSSAAANSKF